MVKKHTHHPKSDDVNVLIENNILHINLDNIKSVHVYSITGQLLLMQNTNMIDIQSLPNGVYTILIDTDKSRITKKILVL